MLTTQSMCISHVQHYCLLIICYLCVSVANCTVKLRTECVPIGPIVCRLVAHWPIHQWADYCEVLSKTDCTGMQISQGVAQLYIKYTKNYKYNGYNEVITTCAIFLLWPWVCGHMPWEKENPSYPSELKIWLPMQANYCEDPPVIKKILGKLNGKVLDKLVNKCSIAAWRSC